MLYALIMAGGSGTRLWPLSRKDRPKQALPLISERTMFQISVDRLTGLIPPERVYVVTNAQMAELFKEQVPGIPARNYVIEPFAKDSGPAAALGMAHIAHDDPDATIAILTADHHIGDEDGFRQALLAAQEAALGGAIVTLGITPSYAATGFGYIERGDLTTTANDLKVYRALSFREKPSAQVAQEWLASGNYSWNAGMFILTAKTGLGEFARQQPEFAAAIAEVQRAVGAPAYASALARAWEVAPRKSMDYAIMEGAQNIAVIPVDIGWSDIGNWASLLEVRASDVNGNVIIGDHLGKDNQGTLIHGGNRLVVTIGLQNLVVVDTADALFIAPVNRVHEVKQMVDELKARNRGEVL